MTSHLPIAGLVVLVACDATPSVTDGGTVSPDATSSSQDANPVDAGHPADAQLPDTGPGDAGFGTFACDHLDPGPDPTAYARHVGRLEIVDTDLWDSQDNLRRRVRNAGWGFAEFPRPIRVTVDGVLFRSVPADGCVTVTARNEQTPLGMRSNIGSYAALSEGGREHIRIERRMEPDGPSYFFASNAETRRFFDPAVTPLNRAWRWSTPGDLSSGVQPAEATVAPVEGFEITPAFTSTPTPILIDGPTTIRWTPPTSSPAEMSIVLARAINPNGDTRAVVCRPEDDGEFTITASATATLGAVSGLPFDISVARSAIGALCNEGVPAGVFTHTLVFTGSAVVQ